jgi:hypothetical protein
MKLWVCELLPQHVLMQTLHGALEVSLHRLGCQKLQEFVLGEAWPRNDQALDNVPLDVPHCGQQDLQGVNRSSGFCGCSEM